MKLIEGYEPPRDLRRLFAGYFSCKSCSSPSNAQLASAGETIPPCGVPSVVSWRTCFSMYPDFNHCWRMARSIRDVRQKPIVGNLIETGLDVTFQNPLRVRCVGQHLVALLHRLGAGPLLTEPIRVSISVGFQHRIERKKMQCLVSSIDHA